MGIDKKVVNSSTCQCPAGKSGVVTTIVFDDGTFNQSCSAGSDYIGAAHRSCEARVVNHCRVSDQHYHKRHEH